VVNSSGSQTKTWVLTLEAFDKLLAWLDPDREQAGKIYEEIRSKLIQGFQRHECLVPEELADETINRVAKRLPDIEQTYVGDRTRYFYGVAHNVHREQVKKSHRTLPLHDDLPDVKFTPPHTLENVEPEYMCLQSCMQHLTERNREVMLQYYSGEKQDKIRLRKELARRLEIDIALLRLRAQRIRVRLKRCILACLATGKQMNAARR
jgi:DNA-directed RNA polymerase specialized sigma24 family protein